MYRLLGGHYSSVFAHTDSCANPSGSPLLQLLASFGESEQVATSPCCQRDLPDVISANPSSDAWSHTTAGLTECTYLFLPPCHRPSPTGVWVGLPASTREHDFPRSVFSRLQTFLYVQASEFAHLPDRSYPCAYCRRAAEASTSEQNMLRYLRMHRICLPSEYRQLTARGLSPRKIRSLVGCSPLFTLRWTFRNVQCKTRGRADCYSFLVRLFHPRFHTGSSRRTPTIFSDESDFKRPSVRPELCAPRAFRTSAALS